MEDKIHLGVAPRIDSEKSSWKTCEVQSTAIASCIRSNTPRLFGLCQLTSILSASCNQTLILSSIKKKRTNKLFIKLSLTFDVWP